MSLFSSLIARCDRCPKPEIELSTPGYEDEIMKVNPAWGATRQLCIAFACYSFYVHSEIHKNIRHRTLNTRKRCLFGREQIKHNEDLQSRNCQRTHLTNYYYWVGGSILVL